MVVAIALIVSLGVALVASGVVLAERATTQRGKESGAAIVLAGVVVLLVLAFSI